MNRTGIFSAIGELLLALLIGALPFAAPQACAQALREGLQLCAGPLLLSLYPFLIVSHLLIQCPMGQMLGMIFQPAARFAGVRAACAGRVLLIGALGGFAPAANAAAEAVRSSQLTPEQADALLPACVCSAPSFVILTVGQTLLGSTELGVLLFFAQIFAGYLSAALINRLGKAAGNLPAESSMKTVAPVRLDAILAQAVQTYLKLCGFVLFFRLVAAGVGSILPPPFQIICAIFLEVCSGCDLAARTGYWASTLCCAALSLQGVSVCLQVRAICPEEMNLKPFMYARILHLPISIALFYLFLPGGEREAFTTLCKRVLLMRRVPLDCALLVFLTCCLAVCELTNALNQVRSKRQNSETENF